MKRVFLLFSMCLCGSSFSQQIAFTFDDGSVKDMPGYTLEAWNEKILDALEKHDVRACFFINGSRLTGVKGEYVLRSWNDKGHRIGNHTYSHPYFHSKKVSLAAFEADFLKNDSLIRQYSNFYPYFRFPYLKEGDTEEKVNGFREFLKEQGYKNAHVTIDASDWYINDRLLERLNKDPKADTKAYREYYIAHLFDRAVFYDSLTTALTGRKIRHNILLHHNLAAALFLDELIRHFKEQGWEIVNSDEAYQDPFYEQVSNRIPAGESLAWSLAKASGKFEKVLRYPAEDGSYEKEKMDALGL
ncbi:MAG: polysaccharide deacetylase [Crocinitomicaceae bacterium]|nr:polysaccharide deacetylase [Crocinitomicaceae bacterium]